MESRGGWLVDWVAVESSAIRATAFDPDLGVIYIEYNDGDRYYYGNCTEDHWRELMAPETSKGTYVNRELKQHPFGKYSG
jgi:hypothetical protein